MPSESIALLLDALSLDPTRLSAARASGLSAQAWATLVETAIAQRLAGLLAARMTAHRLDAVAPPEIMQALRAAARQTAVTNLTLFGQLQRVVDTLHEHDIRVLVLKGPHLADLVYKSRAARSIGDLDLMVPWKDLARAGAAVEALGYRPVVPYVVDTDAAPYYGHQLPRFMQQGAAPVEIHWNIADAGDGVDAEALWARAVPARIADRDVMALGVEDSLVHVCAHAAYMHSFEFGLRPLYDIAAIITHAGDALDWEAVISRSRAWGWARGNALALRLTSELVGVPVPPAIGQLAPDAPAPVRAAAVSQMSATETERAALMAMPPAVASMESLGPIDKLRHFWRRVFLPREVLAQIYAVTPASPVVVLLYPLRAFDVLRGHAGRVVRLHRDGDELQALAQRKTLVLDWLQG